MEIVLKFNKDTLNFHKKELSDIEIANEAVWLVNCAMAAIDESYRAGSIRSVEMENLRKSMMTQIRAQLNEEQLDEFESSTAI